MASKIVVIGSVDGAFRQLFSKLTKVQSKNDFSLAIITGDLFGSQSSDEDVRALLQGSISVPLPTYFSLGKNSLPDLVKSRLEADEDLCPNLFFLGRRGTYKTTEGIRIVTLGGTFAQQGLPVTNADTKYLPTYTESDARALNGAHSADILVTNDWPLGIKTGSKVEVPPGTELVSEQQSIADLASALKPRYHLSNSDTFFYEREPFFHMPSEDDSPEKPITRFLGLASFNNDSKQKWLYAFSLDPKAATPVTIPAGVTASPLSLSRKRSALPSQNSSYSRFNGHSHHEPARKRRRGPQNHGPEECFFCLSNSDIAQHMICSIGDESYVTIAKGPLPLPSTYPTLGFPMHMLIIPFAHTSNFHDIAESSSAAKTYAEMQRYRLAIYDMLASATGARLGAVCWEVSRKFVRHFVWQILPVPADRIKRGLVEAAFKLAAETANLPKFSKFPATDVVPADKGDYFRVWTWTPPVPGLEGNEADEGGVDEEGEEGDEEKATTATAAATPKKKTAEKSILLPINEEVKFDIQFGRKVMANLLQLESRTSWQDAAQSVEEETASAARFKMLFNEHDFAAA